MKTFPIDLIGIEPMKRVTKLLCCIFAMFVLTSFSVCHGQDVSGMTGVVTDSSGAALSGATVTLKNSSTGLQFTATTNSQGVYRFSEVPPGEGYTATFAASGFTAENVDNIYLTVSNIRTQNATLKVGSQGQVVEVTASGSEVTIDTTTATIGNTFNVQQLNNLPVQQRNDPIALFTLQPGVTDSGSVTGARVDQNNVTVDGLDVNDFATGGAQQNNNPGSGLTTGFVVVGHAPVDSVEEFKGTVGGLQSNAGPSSGGQFQLVTKSGTNQFHGNINEYHRDPSLVANSWFSNNANPIVPRNHLIQNQFGGNVGGPVLKNKLFFFFDFNDSRILSSLLVQRTVPLDNLRAGNLGYLNNAGGVSYLTPTQIQGFDPAGIGISSTFQQGFSARFPHSNNSVTGDGVNSGGYSFNAPNNDFETNYVTRMDYNLNDHMNVWGRFTIARENSVQNPNEFAGDPATNPFVDRTYSFVIGHNWVIGTNKTNRVFIGQTVQKNSFPNSYNPDGSTFLTFGDGTGPALASSLYLNPNAQARRVPIPVVGDDFSWTKGSHTWQFGGTFKDIKAHFTNVADYNTAYVGLGGYTLSLCGPTPGDCNGPSLRPADISTSGGTTPDYDYDQAFTFLLGRIGNVNSDFNYNAQGSVLPQLTGDQRYYRYYQTQVYAADSWKVTRNLTLSYGVNYQNFSVPYETRGLESTINTYFDKYFDARIAQSNASLTGPTAVPLISYVLGGKAVNGPPLYQPENHLFAPRFGFAFNPSWDQKTVFNGSIGIVYDRTIIAAVQQIQDADSYLFQQTSPTPLGIPGDPYNSVRTGPRLDSKNGISTVTITPPATPKPPYQPFTANGVPFGLQNGLAFNATIDPHLKTPYSIAFNGGMQHSFAADLVMKLSYAGRLGRRLLAQTDANQVLEFPDPVSGQLLSAAMANVTQQLRSGATSATVTPQPWFENVIGTGGCTGPCQSYTSFLVANFGPFVQRGDFGDTVQFLADNGAPLNVGSAAQFSENTFYGNKGFSSYNAMLLTVAKNFSHGLNFDFNYTFAHSIDNVSFFANSSGDTGIGGIGLICDAIRPRECRANSDFDINQIITADAVYQLPFGKGKAFLSSPSTWMNEIVGGWSLSGVNSWHTGQAWGTNSNAFVASYSNDAPGILVGQKSAVATHLQKPVGGGVNIFSNQANATAAYVGPIGFRIGSRNGLRGPNFFNADLGLAKNFPIYGDRVKADFRADAFNALNHPNFGLPASNSFNGLDEQDVTNTSQFGNISYTVIPSGNLNNGARVLQLSLRVEF
ncbi:MAG: carboxypeptidase-like regulatory domain-containing protein [Acidobacteriaceae bacterium]